MLLPLKSICSASKVRRDGTSLIFLQYCKSESDKTLLNTTIAIPPKFWNKKLCRITDDLPQVFGSAGKLNLELHRMFRLAEDIIHLAMRLKIEDNVLFFKKTFRPDLTTSELEEIEKKQETLKPEQNLDFFISSMNTSNQKKKRSLKGRLVYSGK